MTNVVLMVWDAFRADHSFIMDYYRDTTPFLKSLAGDSYIFENAIAQGFWSLPSIASIFTGKYPSQHGMTMQTADESRSCPNDNTMLTESLKALGYSTWAFVDDDWLNPRTGFTRGFDFYESYPAPNGKRADNIVADIQERFKPQLPFFLFVNLLESHDPYWVPEEFRVWAKRRDLHADVNSFFVGGLDKKWGDQEFQQLKDRYDEAIRWEDHVTEVLWKWMDYQGYLEDTIFIVLGDHGEYLGEHGLFHHTCAFYDESLRVFLQIWGAGSGRELGQFELRRLHDFILDVTRGATPCEMDLRFAIAECPEPRNIINIFRAKRSTYDNPHLFSAKTCVRTKEWKYIHNSRVQDELYDLIADPHERVNIFDPNDPCVLEAREIVEENLGRSL